MSKKRPYTQVGTVTGVPFFEPIATAVSDAGVLYVADLGASSQPGIVYAFGNGYDHAPTASYSQPNGTAPRSIAIGKDGSLYVADGNNVVLVYKGGSKPVRTLQGPPDANGSNPPGVAVDSDNTAYIAATAGQSSSNYIQVIQYAPGSRHGKTRDLYPAGGNNGDGYFHGAIGVDASKNLLIGAIVNGCGSVLVFPPGKTTQSETIGAACSGYDVISGLSLLGRFLYFDDESSIEEYSYPSGRPIGVSGALGFTFGAAAGNAQP